MNAAETGDGSGKSEASGVLAGKVAVVTGASRGIGRATATMLAGAGAQVAGCARQAVDEVIACDVGHPADVERFAGEVLRRFGPPDLLVNNAGLVARAPLAETSLQNWDAVLD